ncbi:class I SAM-dependent DNA methyltransferase [Hydrogenimonas cancrithermarum]|uniref:Methyltransferase domain-containing protein n=1 Tax=Hydrogenimonas cancrithermarum TaxID=2993563 RepID=A0ABM8FJ04_9BACT|nr:class I SAM-dependent methyltransferase [Hydrogenimonas cancrithermarum]BDY12277.1 hypothetical protein HCR_05890 [Hydrogenimonas cancrithermarum]
MGLELYAKIEPLLGFEEAVEALYDFYIGLLKSWQPDTLIDIGCGSGKFLKKAQSELGLEKALGVDLSERMVEQARALGIDAEALDVCDVKESFDAATAIFDVLNYLPEGELKRFMACVGNVLKPGGIFVADINTLYGFEEVAQGSLVRSDDAYHLSLDSVFEGGLLKTRIDYFEKSRNGCFLRETDTIVQYYHTPDTIAGMSGLELIQSYPLQMYGDEADKEILVFRKTP